VPAVSIHLFNHVDDAWEHDLQSWLEEGTRAALSGQKVWMVCRSFLQANWLRRQAMDERNPIMGVRFFDLRRLRRELYLYAGLPTPSFGRETLSLLLRARMEETEASSAFVGQVLDALDDLAACGWLDRFGSSAALDLLGIPQKLRDPAEQIINSLFWRPKVDRALAERAIKISGLRIGFFGLDARSLNQQELLAAAVSASEDARFWLAQPFVGEEIFMRWVTRLESRMAGVVAVTPSEGGFRPYEDLVSRFVYVSGPPVNLPRLVRAERWSDQIRAVVAIVQNEFEQGSRKIAVMVPEGSPTGPALVEALVSAGIAVADEFRSSSMLDHSESVHRWLTEWIGGPKTPEKVLEFFNLLGRNPESFGRFRRDLFKRFDERQTRSISQLLLSDSSHPWARELLNIDSDWPESGAWKQLETEWQKTLLRFKEFLLRNGNIFRPVTISLEPLQPNWDEIRNALGDLLLSSQVFLRFVGESLANAGRVSHPGASHRYAPVVVSTTGQLHATSWDSVILTDGVGDLWTKLATRDSLLGQEFRKSARKQDLLLVSLQEESLLQEDSVLQLLLHARRFATICFYDKEENGEEVDANRFVTFLRRSLHAEPERFEAPPAVATEVFSHLSRIRELRCDPEHPFDQYLLNFNTLDLNAVAWSASERQAAIAAPGSFAFRLLFGLKRSWDLTFERDEHRTLGIAVHTVLAQVLKNPFGELFRKGLSELRESARLKEILQANGNRHLGKIIRELNMPRDDLWWRSVIDKAVYLVVSMLKEVDGLLEKFPFGASEHATGEIVVQSPPMNLKGQFDLLLANADAIAGAETAIVDFKTTNSMRQLKPETGEGFQLVAYHLLVQAMGAASCQQIALMPMGAKDLSISKAYEAVEAKLLELAGMQANSCFGHAPLLRTEFGVSESLPLATLPIPAWVLRRKRVLTLENLSRK
jgi:hypothetical protein